MSTLMGVVRDGLVRTVVVKLHILSAIVRLVQHNHSNYFAHQGINEAHVRVFVQGNEVSDVELSGLNVPRSVHDEGPGSYSALPNETGRAHPEIAFEAPEAILSAWSRRCAADAWSVATFCTLIFTGKTASVSLSQADMLYGATSGRLSEASRTLAEGIELLELRRVVIRCLSQDPGERPAVCEVSQVVEEYLDALRIASLSDGTLADPAHHPLWKGLEIKVSWRNVSPAGRDVTSLYITVYRSTAMEQAERISPRQGNSRELENDIVSFVYPCDKSNTGDEEDNEEFVVELRCESGPAGLLGRGSLSLKALRSSERQMLVLPLESMEAGPSDCMTPTGRLEVEIGLCDFMLCMDKEEAEWLLRR